MTLPPLVERKHGEGALDKLTSDIYEIMAYGEGIRESLPKSLVSSGSSKAENAQTSTSQVIVNSQVPSVLSFDLSAMQATIQKDVDVAITELKATTFEELLRCRNEIADLTKEFRKVRQKDSRHLLMFILLQQVLMKSKMKCVDPRKKTYPTVEVLLSLKIKMQNKQMNRHRLKKSQE